MTDTNDSRRYAGIDGQAAAAIFDLWKQHYQEAQGTFKRLYDDAESAWSGVMHEAISSEPFARMMTLTREMVLTSIEFNRDSAQRTMEILQLPTTADVARVAELIVGVEDKLQRMNDRLDEMTDLLHRAEGAAHRASDIKTQATKPEASRDNQADDPKAGRTK